MPAANALHGVSVDYIKSDLLTSVCNAMLNTNQHVLISRHAHASAVIVTATNDIRENY